MRMLHSARACCSQKAQHNLLFVNLGLFAIGPGYSLTVVCMEAPPGFTLTISTPRLLVNLSCVTFDIGVSCLELPPTSSSLFGHCTWGAELERLKLGGVELEGRLHGITAR